MQNTIPIAGIVRKIAASHRKTASYLIMAALCHLEAASYYIEGKGDHVAGTLHMARKYLSRANETQGENEMFI